MVTPAEFKQRYPLTDLPDTTISALAPVAEERIAILLVGVVSPVVQSVKAAECAMVQHLYWENEALMLSSQVGREVTIENRGRFKVTQEAVDEARINAENFSRDAAAFAQTARGSNGRPRRSYGAAR